MGNPTTTPLIGRVENLEPFIRQHADIAERDRRLPTTVVDAMLDAGLFGMFVPRALGGLEAPLVEGFEAIERLARIDSAAAWNLQILAVAGGTTGATLSDEGAAEVYADPQALVAGGFNPPGMAVRVDGGYMLTGRWPFASGCQHASWFVDPAIEVRDGEPQMSEQGQPVMLMLVYPAVEAEIIETWDSLGMRGTGSHDIVADNVFVPDSRVAPMIPNAPLGSAYQGPLYRLGLMPTVLSNAVVALGIARGAIDEAVELAKAKTPAFMQPRPVDRGVVQMHLARAEATLNAARAYFYGSIDRAWESVSTDGVLAQTERFHLQLAASHAAEAAATAVDHVQACVGSSGVREEQHRFARHFRDVHTVTQHALCSPSRFESMGQVMLGLETDWVLFNL